jgi:hypothetical protein
VSVSSVEACSTWVILLVFTYTTGRKTPSLLEARNPPRPVRPDPIWPSYRRSHLGKICILNYKILIHPVKHLNMIALGKRKIKIRKDFYMLSTYKTWLQFSLQVSVARTVEVSRYFFKSTSKLGNTQVDRLKNLIRHL